MRSKYINPFTDYGFKRLFREEANKNLLVAFLNDILQIKDKIIKIDFIIVEMQSRLILRIEQYFIQHFQ